MRERETKLRGSSITRGRCSSGRDRVKDAVGYVSSAYEGSFLGGGWKMMTVISMVAPKGMF